MQFNQEHTLQDSLRTDPVYQNLLIECAALEQEYLRILNSLSAEDKEFMECYISLCEELDHRKLTLVLTI